MKVCCFCKESKEETEFNKKASTYDGLQGKCKECSRRISAEHYRNNPKPYHDRAKLTKKKTRELVDAIKSAPCVDCGKCFPPVCMDFDHIDPNTKVGSIARMVGSISMKSLLEEIAKCDIVCANCHRIRTSLRPFVSKSNKRFN